MKTIVYLALVAVLATPAFGGIIDNGDGSFEFTMNSPNKFATGFCHVAWRDQNCSGGFSFGNQSTTFVALAICTQGEADAGDPLPTLLCGASQQANNLCPSDWPVDTVLIPTKAACATFVNWGVKAWGKAFSVGGLNLLEQDRIPSPGDHSGDITD